jgi:cysteine desulfurase/selenocysteine lyase
MTDALGANVVGSARSCVYLDHGATSWPKPPEVVDAVVAAMTTCGANPGRGAYSMALAASRLVFESRRACADLLGVPDARDLAFVSGCTEACNLMLKGLLVPGDRVVVSSMEHNAISRPLHVLSLAGVRVDIVQADATGTVHLGDVERAVRAQATRAVVCQHASNVTGAIQPIADIADIAHENGALLLVDGAQAAGHLDVDLAALDVDAYAVSGHKGLLGPQGVGLLYLRPGLEAVELLQGGTGGGSSEEESQPQGRPERYEAGTPNTPGIAGLGAAVRLLAAHGAQWRATEQRLFRELKEGLLAIAADEPCVPTLSLVSDHMESDRIAFLLDRRYGIAVRSGLHCAPWAHRTIGTLESGSVRMGVGYGTTDYDVAAALTALAELLA